MKHVNRNSFNCVSGDRNEWPENSWCLLCILSTCQFSAQQWASASSTERCFFPLVISLLPHFERPANIEGPSSSRKVGCVFPMVTWSRLRIGQHWDDNHRVGRRTQLDKSVIIVETNLFTEIDTREYSNPNTKNETKKNYQHCSLISHHWFLYHNKFQIRILYF